MVDLYNLTFNNDQVTAATKDSHNYRQSVNLNSSWQKYQIWTSLAFNRAVQNDWGGQSMSQDISSVSEHLLGRRIVNYLRNEATVGRINNKKLKVEDLLFSS